MGLVFLAQDDENSSMRALECGLLATSFVVFTVFLCILVRHWIARWSSGTTQEDGVSTEEIEIGPIFPINFEV